MSEIRTVNIQGSAAAILPESAANQQAKKTRRNKKNQLGGFAEPVRGVSPVMNIVKGMESNSSIAASAASPNTNTWLKYPQNAPVPPVMKSFVQPSHVPASPDKVAAPTGQYAVQQGGNKQIKVELKKKTNTKKVQLQPKKAEVPKAHVASKKIHTKKIRKVTLGVSSLHKRMTRAKRLHKNIKEMPIDKLKEHLVKKGLIKTTSKAPESVLRQIASDAEVVAKKAL
jgi:hypothetical protein